MNATLDLGLDLGVKETATALSLEDGGRRLKEGLYRLLKEFPARLALRSTKPEEGFRFSALEQGIPRGAVVEVSGAEGGGKTELVLRFLAENPEARVAWIEEEPTIYPCAFPASRVALSRVLFVEPDAGRMPWTVHQVLRSQVFGLVVLRPRTAFDERVLRRLQLGAERARTTVVLLSEEAARRGTWPIAVQLRVSRSNEQGEARALYTDVLKYHGSKSWRVRVG